MPDIDMDFDSRYRGRDDPLRRRDATAATTSPRSSRSAPSRPAAVRDAARVLGYPYAVGDQIAKAMPPLVMGRDTPLKYCFEQHPEVRRRLQGGGRAAGHVRHRPRRQAGRRRRQGPRGPEAQRRHPRRRGGDHQGTAHHVPADPAQARDRAATPKTPRSSRSTRCTASRSSGC